MITEQKGRKEQDPLYHPTYIFILLLLISLLFILLSYFTCFIVSFTLLITICLFFIVVRISFQVLSRKQVEKCFSLQMLTLHVCAGLDENSKLQFEMVRVTSR